MLDNYLSVRIRRAISHSHIAYAETVPIQLVPIEFKSGPCYVKHINFIQDKKCIPIHYTLSFQLFINSPPQWTSLAVLQTMLKLLPRSQLRITINFITIV